MTFYRYYPLVFDRDKRITERCVFNIDVDPPAVPYLLLKITVIDHEPHYSGNRDPQRFCPTMKHKLLNFFGLVIKAFRETFFPFV